MDYKEVKGDLFRVDNKKWVLAHCISADVTPTKNMNQGIANIFRKKYPEMAKSISPNLECGKAIRYKKNNQIVYNLISKEKVWQKAKGEYKEKYYNNLKSALFDIKKQMAKNDEKFLAMPRIASGLDGGDWEYIRDVIQDVFKDTEVSIQIKFIDEPIKIGGAKYLMEPAKSGQSKCKDCGKKIQKGFLRLKESLPVKNFIKDVYYCDLCAEKALIKIKSKAEELLKEFRKKNQTTS